MVRKSPRKKRRREAVVVLPFLLDRFGEIRDT
jgi:hypothetical protein